MIKLDFDFRSKIAILMLTMLLVALLKRDMSIYILLALLTIYLIVQGYTRKAIGMLIVAMAAIVLKTISKGQGITILMPDMLLFIIIRVMGMLMAAQPIIGMPPGEVVACFKKMHVRDSFALSVTFMLRFMPTVRGEFRSVFAALRLRGIISFKHPLTSIEYILVPIIIRASKVSEELAASAEVRGIACPEIHTCRRDISFKMKDWFLCILGIMATVLMIILEKAVGI